MPGQIQTTLYTDPACPWAYSEIPALRVIDWRYGDQLDWRLVMIGLTESAQQYIDRGYTPLNAARGHAGFRRYGMPFSPAPKARVAATARACRAIVAARLLAPGSEWAALRALQLTQFTTGLVLDDDDAVARVVGAATGLDAETVRGAARRRRHDGGVRARPCRDAAGGRQRRRAAGQDGRHRRPGALHRFVGHVRARRGAARGRRLPAGRGLRRPAREPRPVAATGGPCPTIRPTCSPPIRTA